MTDPTTHGARIEMSTLDPALVEAIRFQRDLYLTWQYAAEMDGLALMGRGYLTRAVVRSLRARLAAVEGTAPPPDAAEIEDPRLHFMRRLAERLGLLIAERRQQPSRRQGDTARTPEVRLVAADRGKVERYLTLPLSERLRLCARLWVAGGWWPDAPDARAAPPRLMVPAPPRIALARRHLLDALAVASPGVEFPVPPTRDTLAHTRRTRTPAGPGPRRPTLPRAAAPGADAAIHAAALLGPLAWLGFVTLDEPGAAGTAAGAYRVGLPASALRPVNDGEPLLDLPETHGRVVALPTLALIAYPPLTAPALIELDTCARRDTLERTARYTLTRAAFAAAGWGADATAARLEALIGRPLPPNVRATLADWERHVERLRLTLDVRVLTVDDPAVLDALLADRATSGWIERRLTPTALLLAPDALPGVRAWLLRRGHLPASVHT